MPFTADQLALQAYLEAQKAQTLAWIAEDPDNRWASYAVTDPAHWAEYGITTVEQYRHHEAATAVYEMTRELFGYKPSWSVIEAMTLDELESELQKLGDFAREEEAREEESANADIQAMLDAGAPDRETAERWVNQL